MPSFRPPWGLDNTREGSEIRVGGRVSGVHQTNKFCSRDGHIRFPTLVGALNFVRMFAKIVLMKQIN